ncbi:hypothetical protein RUND412_010842, partial [Rhizina undulata]
MSCATVDCYTCRRRRVRCDKALPSCSKCIRTGLECLGYKKPLVWNKGVASRGKMMGKTFPQVFAAESKSGLEAARKDGVTANGNAADAVQVQQTQAKRSVTAAAAPKSPRGRAGSAGASRLVARQTKPRLGSAWNIARTNNGVNQPLSTAVVAITNSITADGNDEQDSEDVVEEIVSNQSPEELNLISFNPPVIKNLDSKSRFFIQYFAQRVCRDFILFERPNSNPYLNLLPIAADHPALLNALLAVAARHHANNCGSMETHALMYKGRAFKYLYNDLQQHNQIQKFNEMTEPALAAVMLFVFFEALDSGMDTWKIHLTGARSLIQLRGGLKMAKSGISQLFSVLMNHVALVDIIGRTLSSPSASIPPWEGSFEDIFDVLEEGENYSFLGCPAEILQTILSITVLHRKMRDTASSAFSHSPSSSNDSYSPCTPNFINSYPSPATSAKEETGRLLPSVDDDLAAIRDKLLARISNFDPKAWTTSRKKLFSLVHDISECELFHHVSAYKSATTIFALQTLFPSSSSSSEPMTPESYPSAPSLSQTLTSELIFHLSHLSPGSMLYKGAVWPIFLAGTGAATQEQRDFVRGQLKKVWGVLPQFNIRNAGVVLEGMWRDEDEGRGK